MWSILRVFFLGGFSLLALSACATTTSFLEPPLPEAGGLEMLAGDASGSVEPSPETRLRVVFDADDRGAELAKEADLKTLLRSGLIGDLNAVGVDDIDRDMEKGLIEELRLIVAKGGRYEGDAVADYAVIARFLESSLDVGYSKAIKIPFMDEAEYKKKPGSCDYEVTIHIALKILDLSASGRVVKTINVKESAAKSIKTMRRNCQSVISESAKKTLASSATKDALFCFSLPLQTFLAPRGHISSARRDEEGHTFFRISKGKTAGIKAGDTILIYGAGTGVAQGDSQVIARGRVHQKIGSNHAWVVVNNEAEASAVKRGDLAKVSYTDKITQSKDWVKCRSIRTES